MDIGTELLLKMIMAEKSGTSASKYQEIYRNIKSYSPAGNTEQLIVLEGAA